MMDKETANLVGIAVIAGLVGIALTITAVVFGVINALALFGPNGDTASVWHWVWLVVCVIFVWGSTIARSR
jgi:hypothetical protein